MLTQNGGAMATSHSPLQTEPLLLSLTVISVSHASPFNYDLSGGYLLNKHTATIVANSPKATANSMLNIASLLSVVML